MAIKDEPKAHEPPKVPGLEPGAKMRDAEAQRYGSPPLSYPDAPRTADSAAAMILQMKQEIMRELRGEAHDTSAEVENAARRTRERDERKARAAQEHLKEMATYKARGAIGEPAGEIPSETPGMGRRLVMGGETFRYAGRPGLWMEPIDALAKRKVQEEEDRREAIARTAEENSLAKAGLKQASEALDRASLDRGRRAAGGSETSAGSGG